MNYISEYLWGSSSGSHQLGKGEIKFKVNNSLLTAPKDLPPSTRLVDYIRDHLHHKGTKFMCREAGCGACIVTVKRFNATSKKTEYVAVNSCIVPLFLCSAWNIITVEGIGSTKHGVNKIQSTLAKFAGTQCGYCSPGFVMNMNSLVNSKAKLSMAEIEDSFSGNICRCTGYRPILDAFKSFANDASEDLKATCHDIEEVMSQTKMCPITSEKCTGKCSEEDEEDFFKIDKSFFVDSQDNAKWIRVTKVIEIYRIFETMDDTTKYMLVGGHTSDGVYRVPDDISVFIDVNGVDELHGYTVDEQTLTVGASTTLATLIEILEKVAGDNPQQFFYLHQLVKHINLVANVPVRNIGTIAGNLMMKHNHHEFPSDIFLLLEACKATLTIGNEKGVVDEYWLSSFFHLNMRKRVILKVNFRPLDNKSYVFRSFKIMPRAQNAPAYVSGAFLFKLDKEQKYLVQEKPNIVYSRIRPNFIHARNTEEYLLNKTLLDKTTIREACRTLSNELQPDLEPVVASPEYRRSLAVNLLYKCILNILSTNVSEKFRSGGLDIERPLSSGKQDYQLDKSFYPVGQPIQKLEAVIQCTGEAEYTNDIRLSRHEVFAAVVLSQVGPAKLEGLDASAIKDDPGFVALLTAKDVPGLNTITVGMTFGHDPEELFVTENIEYAGQLVGAVVATSQPLANKLAEKVIVNVSNVQKPKLDMEAIIRSADPLRLQLQAEKLPIIIKPNIKYKLSGTFRLGSQYHFTMETQTCHCVPIEDGMEVYAATQWATMIQTNTSAQLAIPMHSVKVIVRRCGGAYGSKLGRSSIPAGVCAVAAHALKRPVRTAMQLESNMRGIGKRDAVYVEYEVAVSGTGEIQTLALRMYHNSGRHNNESYGQIGYAMHFGLALYDSSPFHWTDFDVKTDIPSNTFCRAPGSCESIGALEYIMEHIAYVTKLDPITVRMNNLSILNKPVIPPMLDDLKTRSDFDSRVNEVAKFNQANRWKKRGISVTFMDAPYTLITRYHVVITIYAPDGAVHVTHGGVEIGQGINTKVAQAVCYKFGIELKLVKIKPTNTFSAPMDDFTADSNASDAVTKGTIDCCDILLLRLAPVRLLHPTATWPELITQANKMHIDLMAEAVYSPILQPISYEVYGICISEVEIDLLTGKYEIRRVDLMEDVGDSMNQYVDIGQVEGAYVMGLGYWLNERLVYDNDTGKLLTDRTWTYSPPMAKDIPIDFRVNFRRNAPNPTGVFRSKLVGEPPLCLSIAVPLAMRNALVAARKDAQSPDEWLPINLPYTPENVLLSSATNLDQFDI